MIIEVCAFDVEWAIKAARGGADRIELCSNYPQGGTTPSYGTIKKVRPANVSYSTIAAHNKMGRKKMKFLIKPDMVMF